MPRLLVVEDNSALSRTLAGALSARFESVEIAATVSEARAALAWRRPDVVLLDMQLPDGTGFDVLDAIEALAPMPVVVAMSASVGTAESFRLGQRGVRAYLPKPVGLHEIERAIDEAEKTPPDMIPFVRASVGRAPLHKLEERVRRTMVNEAMARTEGSKKRAAGLLSISRQTLQHVLRALSSGEP
jgi:DNA-binding NtrC family response regulator